MRCHIEHPFVGQCELAPDHTEMHRALKNFHANGLRWLTKVEWFGPDEVV